MRLWSIHPKYLDCKGLVALWREALLARKVLQGKTKGYKNHPQLIRFKEKPISLINSYLYYIWKESKERCYKFHENKSIKKYSINKIKVNNKQIQYEFEHLKNKLKKRDILQYNKVKNIKKIQTNPIFTVIKGDVEKWEVR